MWKSLALVTGGSLLVGVGGCVDDGEQVSTTDELIAHHHGQGFIPNGVPIVNGAGLSTTDSSDGRIDLNNPFFQNLGTNGRRCISCHLPTAGWTITPEQVQLTFDLTNGGTVDDGLGLGAIFRLNDGANSPTADVSTL